MSQHFVVRKVFYLSLDETVMGLYPNLVGQLDIDREISMADMRESEAYIRAAWQINDGPVNKNTGFIVQRLAIVTRIKDS